MDKTGVIGFTPPFSVTEAIMSREGGFIMVGHVPDTASAVHLGS